MYIYEHEQPKNTDFTGYMVDESSLYSNDFDYHSIHRSAAFEECTKFFNIENEKTRKVLLAVNEADQSVIMQALSTKLYEHIVNKIDSVDFGTIPMSKGDIEKIDHYEQLVDCINVLTQILQNYRQDTTNADTISIALQNMIDRKDIFKQAYRLGVEFPIVTYNTMALSIIGGVSLLISAHIEFIKMPDNKGYDIAFNNASRNKTRDKLLFKNLESFNKMCASGEFDKTMDYAIKNNIKMKHEAYEAQNEGVVTSISALTSKGIWAAGSALGGAAGLAAAHPVITAIAGIFIALIILLRYMRDIIYYFYYSRTKVSEFLDMQSALLYMNAMNIENTLTRDDKEKAKTVEKQRRIADFFQKLSEKIKVKDRTAEVKAETDAKKADNEKFEIGDVISSVPDSANAVLF